MRCFSILCLAILLCSCGGGESGVPLNMIDARLVQAEAAIRDDTCFVQSADPSACNWRSEIYSPSDFAMRPNSGEAILVVDILPALPTRALRYKNRIAAYYRPVAERGLEHASSQWQMPEILWEVLNEFAGPDHVPAQRLERLLPAIESAYGHLAAPLADAAHGSDVFALLADANPAQPLVLVDTVDLFRIAPQAYCDTTGSAASDERLAQAAQHVAAQLNHIMREHNVHFVNFSAGHSLSVVTDGWTGACGTAVPAQSVLHAKLRAYAPIYQALFGTPGVLAAQAAIDGTDLRSHPYDQAGASFGNRLRVGFFTKLASGLDDRGRGAGKEMGGWPSQDQADIFLNTGVLPFRPFEFNATPLLQLGRYGVGLEPITRSTTSWVTPLALSYLIHIRHAQFSGQPMNDALIMKIFDVATPQQCPALPKGQCIYQDPLLHGQVEAVRLGYRP